MNEKENKYVAAMKRVKLSEDGLERGLKRMRNSERDGKVVYMKQRNNRFKAAAVTAACLAAVIGVGSAVYAMNRPFEDSQQPFTPSAGEIAKSFSIKAYDQEGDTSRIMLKELDSTKGSQGSVAIGKDIITASRCVEFPVVCDGEGIESITYSVDNYNSDEVQMYFILNNKFDGVVSSNGGENSSEMTIGNSDDRFGAVNYVDYDTYAATEYTVDFDSQPITEQFNTFENGQKKTAPVYLVVGFNGANDDSFAEWIHNTEVNQYTKLPTVNGSGIISQFMDNHRDETKIDVTANFTDGTSCTRTIQLSYETVGTHSEFGKIVGTLLD